MNKTEFIQLIQTPELPSAKHVAALKQVVADFPYFTASQVLLAKALFNEKHYEYEKYLKQTALAVPDREVLYNYLHNIRPAKPVSPIVEEPVKQHVIPVPSVEPVIVKERTEQIPAAEEKPTEADLEIAPVITTAFVEEVIIDHKAEEPAEIHSVVDEQPQQVEEPALTAETIANDVQELQPENEVVTALETPEPETENRQPQTEEHSFMEWLQLAGKQTHEKVKDVVAEPYIEPVKPVYQEEEPEMPVIRVVEVTKEDIEEAVAKSNINDFGNILDKFIKENPSISRPKAEFFNPVNMARQSVEEDEELVTETLANLLYKQGNLKKAIRAYEKLCLLYPSKMTYFATLIQKIKTELKD